MQAEAVVTDYVEVVDEVPAAEPVGAVQNVGPGVNAMPMQGAGASVQDGVSVPVHAADPPAVPSVVHFAYVPFL